jgi:hypothetical protein
MKRKPKSLPPGYVALVQRLVELIQQWCGEQPTLPDLRWLDPGTTMFIGALQGPAVRYLADSPDAFRLIEWLDVQTDRKATLYQATTALRLLGHLPGGSEPEVLRQSSAFTAIATFAQGTGTTTQVTPSPCGHCGRDNEAASGEKGVKPAPGHFAICAGCAGVNRYDAELRLVRVSEDELAALPDDFRAKVLEMQQMMRQARLQYGLKARQKGVLA